MAWVATAIGGSALIGAGASIFGASQQADASKQAGQAQAQAANQATQQQMQMYQQNRADLAPWRTVGGGALNQLAYLMGINPYGTAGTGATGNLTDVNRQIADLQNQLNTLQQDPNTDWSNPTNTAKVNSFQSQIQNLQGQQQQLQIQGAWKPPAGAQGAAPAPGAQGPGFGSLTQPFQFSTTGPNADPSYQWRLQQGLDAVQKSAAARGGFFSGNTGIALNDYAQGAASNEFANAYNRFMNTGNTLYDRLAGLSGTGQTATTTTANLGAANAANAGQNAMYAAQAQGNAGVNAANAWAGAYGNIGNLANQGMGNYLFYNMMQNNPNSDLNWLMGG